MFLLILNAENWKKRLLAVVSLLGAKHETNGRNETDGGETFGGGNSMDLWQSWFPSKVVKTLEKVQFGPIERGTERDIDERLLSDNGREVFITSKCHLVVTHNLEEKKPLRSPGDQERIITKLNSLSNTVPTAFCFIFRPSKSWNIMRKWNQMRWIETIGRNHKKQKQSQITDFFRS